MFKENDMSIVVENSLESKANELSSFSASKASAE